MTLTGTVLAVDEPKLLSYTWGDDEILRFELIPEGRRAPAWCSATSSRRAGRRATRPAGTTALTGWPAWPATRTRGPAASPPTARQFEPVIGPQEGPPAGDQGEQSRPARSRTCRMRHLARLE